MYETSLGDPDSETYRRPLAREQEPADDAEPTPARADSDGNGLFDDEDRCPTEPEDRDGFEDEDGCPDIDNDADQVLDTDDGAPNDPEDRDGFEDQDGVPDPDNDGDGDVHGGRPEPHREPGRGVGWGT